MLATSLKTANKGGDFDLVRGAFVENGPPTTVGISGMTDKAAQDAVIEAIRHCHGHFGLTKVRVEFYEQRYKIIRSIATGREQYENVRNPKTIRRETVQLLTPDGGGE